MLQRISHRAADLVELLGVEGKLILATATRSLGLIGVLAIACVVAALALLGLAAAAVVALAPAVGTAGALAIISGIVLILAGLVGVTVWSLMLAAHRGEKLSEVEKRLTAERQHLVAELKAPEPPAPAPANPFPSLPNINLGAIDPVLLLAGVGAATAVLGPKRMFKLVGGLAGNLAVVNTVLEAGKAAMAGARGSASTPVGAGTENGIHR